MYNKLRQLEKVRDCLNEIESRFKDERDKFDYLVHLCYRLRNKRELYRAWENLKSVLPKDSSDGYSSVIYYLIKMDYIEHAEKIYDEWLSLPVLDDSDSDSDFVVVIDEPDHKKRNYLLSCYVINGIFKEAETFFKQTIEAGIKPNPKMWENLARLHIQERRISKALSCLRKFFSARGKGWETSLTRSNTVCFIIDICFEENEEASKKALFKIFEEARPSESNVSYLVTDRTYS